MGRVDMAVLFNDNIYLFEFKVVELASEGAAMAQLKEKGYADKYRSLDQPIHLIAVEFSKDTRNITAFEVIICVTRLVFLQAPQLPSCPSTTTSPQSHAPS